MNIDSYALSINMEIEIVELFELIKIIISKYEIINSTYKDEIYFSKYEIINSKYKDEI